MEPIIIEAATLTIEPIGLPTRVKPDGTIVSAMTAKEIEKAVRKSGVRPFIVKARGGEGTGTYGLYVEVVCEAVGHESHTRYFVVGAHVYAASRPAGASKANWRHRDAKSLESALDFLDGVIARPSIKLFGRPLLVELGADSVSQVEAGQIPAARFRGQYRIERDFGKYNFGDEVKSEPLPAGFFAR